MVSATDSDALQRRIQAHDRFGKGDLNAWIFEHLQPAEGHRVVDLGCGTGKQTIALAERVGDRGHVLAIDLSQPSLDLVEQQARDASMSHRVTALRRDLDDLAPVLGEAEFDRAVGSYSLYYAKDSETLLRRVHAALRPNGILFFCGPSRANNRELRTFHFGLRGESPPQDDFATTFMERIGQDIVRALFSEVTVSTFENALEFDGADALLTYWRSYGLYHPDLEDAFQREAQRHFAAHGRFETVKRVLGVRAVR